ncbi:MAG: hypothetical protein ACFFD1_09120 [Candidatus Thorarchaeota archaeon]
MKKIGLIVDKYHLENKVKQFIAYMKNVCKLSIYVEENYIVDFNEVKFDEDLFFIKGKGDVILNFATSVEIDTDIPVINSSRGIWLAYNRFLNSSLLQSAGIQVPNFSLNPKDESPPFQNFIIKNVRDQDNYSFNPTIQRSNGSIEVKDERALEEVCGTKAQYNFFYYQDYIESEFEYKIYGIGEDLYFYRQKPILMDPDKMKSRIAIDPITELGEIAYQVMELFDLKILSLDFLKSADEIFYLTDVNSTPNFNYLKNGPEIVGKYLITQAKK